MEADGSNHRQLTFGDHTDIEPRILPDGRYIVFVSYRTGISHIWRMDADGSNQKQLTNGYYEDSPDISPDGQWIIYHSLDPEKDSVWKISIDGGNPVLLTNKPSRQPVISPDGKLIACFSRDEQANSPWRIVVLPFEGGEPTKSFDIPATVNTLRQGIRWTPDGRALTYIVTTGDVSNVWSQPLDGGSPRQLTDFKEDQIFSFAWSPNGEKLACVRGIMTNEVVLISGFK